MGGFAHVTKNTDGRTIWTIVSTFQHVGPPGKEPIETEKVEDAIAKAIGQTSVQLR